MALLAEIGRLSFSNRVLAAQLADAKKELETLKLKGTIAAVED